jgi:release factor glutamine methyltransferase
MPGAHVTALDLSPEALRYARLNNTRTGAGITLLQADILALAGTPSLPETVASPPDNGCRSAPAGDHPALPDNREFDVIVSNPPYIPASQCGQMALNVTGYEPRGALFVPDGDPLVFYRAIARFARRRLRAGGALYFEIHENLSREVAALLEAGGFSEVTVREDLNSKPRMVRCKLQ